ncbi:MAG: nitroreductase family protein [Candidatus Bathyarchaeia archaeon]
MSQILKIVRERQSSRVPFDPERSVAKQDLKQILEAARWAPTAHNMQNFEIIAVDSKELLGKIGNIKSPISAAFIRENYQQLSFSREEFLQKKTGILATMFPPEWRDPAKVEEVVRESKSWLLSETMEGGPVVLIVIYDPRKRAPASEGDFLGIISLGCVMENMWLVAQDLGISFHVMSVFSADLVENGLKRLLNIPEYMKIAFAIRLGYPVSKSARYLRVRRDLDTFVHDNRFGTEWPASSYTPSSLSKRARNFGRRAPPTSIRPRRQGE